MMNLRFSLCLLWVTLLGPLELRADELSDLEANFSKKLGEAQKSIAERYLVDLKNLQKAYTASGANDASLARQITYLEKQIAAGKPIAFNPATPAPASKGTNPSSETSASRASGDLPTSHSLKMADARTRGTVEFEEGSGKLVGWKTGAATWGRHIRLGPGTYEIVFEFSCPAAGGGTLSIDVPGDDLIVRMGRTPLSTETWAESKSEVVGTFEVEERWAGREFDFGIEIEDDVSSEILHLKAVSFRLKE